MRFSTGKSPYLMVIVSGARASHTHFGFVAVSEFIFHFFLFLSHFFESGARCETSAFSCEIFQVHVDIVDKGWPFHFDSICFCILNMKLLHSEALIFGYKSVVSVRCFFLLLLLLRVLFLRLFFVSLSFPFHAIIASSTTARLHTETSLNSFFHFGFGTQCRWLFSLTRFRSVSFSF